MGTAIIDAPPRGLAAFDANLPAGTLPDGGPFTEAGDKTWHVVPGTTPQVGQGTAKVFRYTVEVENGIDPTTFGGDNAFAEMVDQTLDNPKGWTHNPQFAFVRIDDSGKPDFRISLVSPVTVREGCGYEFRLETSCYNPSFGPDRQARVFINEARWVRGAVPFEGRRRLVSAVRDQPRGGTRHRVRAPRGLRQAGRSGAGDDAADVLHVQRRRRQVRPRRRQGRRQDLPVQSLAVSDRLAAAASSVTRRRDNREGSLPSYSAVLL